MAKIATMYARSTCLLLMALLHLINRVENERALLLLHNDVDLTDSPDA
tara:strand:+ start:132 stop:275 length:144 start_codon:yes stop_codon:yes gene_type:complete